MSKTSKLGLRVGGSSTAASWAKVTTPKRSSAPFPAASVRTAAPSSSRLWRVLALRSTTATIARWWGWIVIRTPARESVSSATSAIRIASEAPAPAAARGGGQRRQTR